MFAASFSYLLLHRNDKFPNLLSDVINMYLVSPILKDLLLLFSFFYFFCWHWRLLTLDPSIGSDICLLSTDFYYYYYHYLHFGFENKNVEVYNEGLNI